MNGACWNFHWEFSRASVFWWYLVLSQLTRKCAFLKHFFFLEARCVLALSLTGLRATSGVGVALEREWLLQGPKPWGLHHLSSVRGFHGFRWCPHYKGLWGLEPQLSLWLFSYSCIIGCKTFTGGENSFWQPLIPTVIHLKTAAFLLMEK